ncbi:MAG: DNA-3-methyladenine glycosylase I [Pseudomonadota bacterium]
MNKIRCAWCADDPIYQHYHDKEWGVPCYDDRRLFEFLLLEGAQAGITWATILNKRENYRRCFDNFDATKIARYSDKKIAALLQNPGIIRNRLKVYSARQNARAFLEVLSEHDAFSDYIWQFVDGRPIINHWKTIDQVPASTTISVQMSKALKKRGFNFVGPTICYAFMQAVGMVNDHTVDCFRYQQRCD